MKRVLQFWLWFVTAFATQGATLNYNLGDYTLNPTNVLFSNLVSTAQITWSMGASGRITGTITFPTVPDENWTNASSVLYPLTAAVVSVSNLNANAVRVTNGVNVGGKITAAEITVTNAAEFFGLMTNHQTWRGTNTFNGGWSEVTGHQTNRGDLYVAGAISGDSGRITNGLTVAGTAGISTLRVTNNATVGGSVSADSATITNALSAGSANVGGAVNASSVRVTNSVTVGGSVSSDSLNVTNALNASGTVGASILRVTNETTHLGLMTNHATSRMTNIFNGGWSEVVSPQTNRSDIYAAGGVFADSARITNALNVSGTANASILRVTNETTHLGLMTNHSTSRMTNIFNGGWNRIQSPSTNETTHWGTNQFNGGWSQVTGNQTNAGFVRATNGLVVPSAGGLALGTGATITNILSASAALTFTAVGAQRYVDASITVTGTTTNDAAFLGVPFQVQQGVGGTNLIFSPFTSNDTVWVRCNNYGTATRSTNGVFNVLVFKR